MTNHNHKTPRIAFAWGTLIAFGLLVIGGGIVSGWPGNAENPQGAMGLLHDHRGILPWLGLGLVLLYYLAISAFSARKRAKGTTVPLFHAPQDLSPAACRYLWRMGFDVRTLATALVSMALKGAVIISEVKGGLGLASTSRNEDALTPGERVVFQSLLQDGPIDRLDRADPARVDHAKSMLQHYLAKKYSRARMKALSWWLAGGAALTLGAWTVSLLPQEDGFIGLMVLAWLVIWSVACGVMALKVWDLLRAAKGDRSRRWRAIWLAGAVALAVFTIPFVAVIFAVLDFTSDMLDYQLIAVSLGCGLLNPAFYLALRSPSAESRAMVDKIEGFRLYLGKVEAPRAARADVLTKGDPNLAYMVALDLEQHWAMRLETALPASDDGDDWPPPDNEAS